MISGERLEDIASEFSHGSFASNDEAKEMAKELLALRKAHEGWKLVPVEPTKEMRLASRRYVARTKITTGPGFYRAMIAAAPEPE